MKYFTTSFLVIFCGLAYAQWTPLTSVSGWELNDISMVSPNDGYIAALDDVYKTTDGGATWSKISYAQPDSTFYQNILKYGTHFFDKNTGVVVGYAGFTGTSVIIRTTDGGSVWDTVYTGNTGGRLYAVSFSTPTNGVAVGKGGKIVRTTDGGLTWNNVTSPTTQDLVSVDCNPGNTSRFLACGFSVILRSTTGGFSWTPNTSYTADFTSVSYGAADTAYLSIRNSNYLYRTTNSGSTWFSRISNVQGFKDLCFVSGDTGYACGNALYRTLDGGITWDQQSIASNQLFMYFYNDQLGFSGGNFGSFTRTTNAGGALWKPVAGITMVGNQPYCKDSLIRFKTHTSSVYTYNWYLNNQLISTASADSVLLSVPGPSILMLVVSNGALSDTSTRTITPIDPFFYSSHAHAVQDTVCTGSLAYIVVDTPSLLATYQLYKNGNALGNPVTPTTSNPYVGFAQTMGTGNNVFTVVASRTTNCGSYQIVDTITIATGTPANVQISEVQTDICWGDTAWVMITNSQPGVLYQLGNIPTVYDTVSGNGDTVYLKYANLQSNEDFDVKAVNKTLNCNWTKYDIVAFTVSTMTLKYNRVEDVYIGQDIQLQNLSDGDSYEWYFDPTASVISSTVAQPAGPISYSTLGEKKITLVGHTVEGCLDTLERRVRVFAPMDTTTPGQVCHFDTIRTHSSKITAYHVDRFGNHYIAGFITVPNAGGYNNFGPSFYHYLQKLDTAGNLLWEYVDKFYNYQTNSSYFAAYISAVTTDPSGNIYICGNFGARQLMLMGSPAPWNFYTYPNLYVAKLNAQGTIQWVSRSYNTSATDRCGASDILYVDSAHIYVTVVGGATIMGPDSNQYIAGNCVLQLTGSGKYVHSYNIAVNGTMMAGYNPYTVSIIPANMQYTGVRLLKRNNGRISIAAYCRGYSITFGNTALSMNPYNTGLYIGTLAPDTGWVHAFTALTGLSNSAETIDVLNCVPAVCTDGNDNIYVAENFTQKNEFSPLVRDTIFASSSQFHVDSAESGCVMRYSPTGQLHWLIHTTAGDVTSLATSNDSKNVYLYGDFERFIGFTGASAQPIGRLGHGRKDAYLAALDSSGNFQWLERIGGDSIDGAHLMVKTCGGVLNCLGYTNGSAATKGSSIQASSYRNFILKYDPTGITCQQQTCSVTDATYRTVYDTVATYFADTSYQTVYVKDSTTVISNFNALDSTHTYDTLTQLTPVHSYDTVHYYSSYQTVDNQLLIYYTHYTDSVVYYDTVSQQHLFTYVDTLHITRTIDTTSIPNDIGEADVSRITLTPNPASSTLLIQSGDIPVNEVCIYNAAGYLVRRVKTEQNATIDISDLAAGSYTAHIKTALGTVVKRWVKL